MVPSDLNSSARAMLKVFKDMVAVKAGHGLQIQAFRTSLVGRPDINLNDGEADLVEKGLVHRDGNRLALTAKGAEWIDLYGHVT